MLIQHTINSRRRTEFIEITKLVLNEVRQSKIMEGICVVYVPHTTAAITVNESADPSVLSDMTSCIDKLVPWNGDYSHSEGNSAAHVKSSIFGSSQTFIISSGELVLGVWQGIFFCEFDGPRNRKIFIQLISA